MRWEQIARRDLSPTEVEIDYRSENVGEREGTETRAIASTLETPLRFFCTVAAVGGKIEKTQDVLLDSPTGRTFRACFDREAARDVILSQMLREAIEAWFHSTNAWRRSRRLLRELLDARQRKRLNSDDCFYERGRQTGTWYRFQAWSGSVVPVRQTSRGRFRTITRGAYWCLHPEDRVSWMPADIVVGQLLTLRADEGDFRTRANFHDGRQEPNVEIFARVSAAQIAEEVSEHESEIAEEEAATHVALAELDAVMQ